MIAAASEEGVAAVGSEEGDEEEDGDEEEMAAAAFAEGVVGGREGVSDPATRRQAHRVAELDARLKVRFGCVRCICLSVCRVMV